MNNLDAMSDFMDEVESGPLELKMLILVGLGGTLATVACWSNQDYWKHELAEVGSVHPSALGIHDQPLKAGAYFWTGTHVNDGDLGSYRGAWRKVSTDIIHAYLTGEYVFGKGHTL